MSNKKSITTISLAAGTAFVASLAMSGTANAAEGANPFAMNELSGGYMQLAEAKCGGKKTEAKCGGNNAAPKAAEAKCGGNNAAPKAAEAKCGGKPAPKKAEGKCGEGKCGGK